MKLKDLIKDVEHVMPESVADNHKTNKTERLNGFTAKVRDMAEKAVLIKCEDRDDVWNFIQICREENLTPNYEYEVNGTLVIHKGNINECLEAYKNNPHTMYFGIVYYGRIADYNVIYDFDSNTYNLLGLYNSVVRFKDFFKD